MLDSLVDFPEAGTKEVFTQFQRGGKVITFDFELIVVLGRSNATQVVNMSSMTHYCAEKVPRS